MLDLTNVWVGLLQYLNMLASFLLKLEGANYENVVGEIKQIHHS